MTLAGGADQGPQIMARLDTLARWTSQPDGLTRLYLSPEHRAAADEVAGWMREAGLAVRIDPLGTVVGRREGTIAGAPAVLMGSHIDTVRDAGRYDGNLGVVAAIAAAERLGRQAPLPRPIEVLAFGDEEGVRFAGTLRGSRAIAGRLTGRDLAEVDGDGVSVAAALAAFGSDPGAWPSAARAPGEVEAYLELHIEQGPVLEAEGLPVGVVTAIAAALRAGITIEGEAGHAGTVPMAMRRDALAAAAETVLAVEARAVAEGAVGTVGRIEALPGAANVIPGQARLTLDLRAPDPAARDRALAAIEADLAAIAARRGVAARLEVTLRHDGCTCSAPLSAHLARAIAAEGVAVRHLPSGAGHDAMAMAALCPVAMLFVRCKGGISHNPAEAIEAADAGLAARILAEAAAAVAREGLP
jgi:allantoate deiminase